MRALVLGVTGHIGSAVARALVGRGWQVTGLSRRSAATPNLRGVPLEWLRADSDDPGAFARAVPGHDLVVDAAAPYPVQGVLARLRREAPVSHALERADRLLAACLASGATLAAVGSFVSHFDRVPEVRPSASPALSRALRALHPYFALKTRVQARLLSAAAHQPVVLVDPVGVLGPWDWKERDLCLVPRTVAGDFPVSTSHLGNLVDNRDVAACLVRAVEQEVFGEPILLAGHSLPMDRWMARIAAAAGVDRRPPGLPIAGGIAGLLALEAVFAAAGRPTPLPVLTMLIVAHCRGIGPSPLQRRLDVLPRPIEQTIADSVAWYASFPERY